MDQKAQGAPLADGVFFSNLPEGMARPGDPVESLLLREYGAMFVARGGVTVPPKIVFRDEAEVREFQGGCQIAAEIIGTTRVELQAAAMSDLVAAVAAADSASLSITPRGPDSGRRSYDETIALWNSRVEPALKHWVGQGRLSDSDADRIAALSPFEQVAGVLRLEEKGIYFAKDLSKSIIYSVAPPGTSQHLAMLAIDVREFDDVRVRAILADHRWFQTVVSDLPHFTYLGSEEKNLPNLGLKTVESGGRKFWVPDI